MVHLDVPIDLSAIQAMFDYLSEDTPRYELKPADGAFIFCRADRRLATTAADLYADNLINWALATGGRGKDSGLLPGAEATYVCIETENYGMSELPLFAETEAKNGAQNCRLGLDALATALMTEWTTVRRLIVVAHSPSVRRLTMMLAGEIKARGLKITLQSVGDGYYFNPASPFDALEVCQELIRMADWPAKYGYPPNTDLDPDLVAYARELEPILKGIIKAYAAAL